MKKMNYFIPVAIVVLEMLSVNQSWAQQIADTVAVLPSSAVPTYPRTKLLSVTYDQAGEADYKVKNTGRSQNEGTIKRGRLQIMGTLPIWKNKRFSLSATEVFTRDEMAIEETVNPLFEDVTKTHAFNSFFTTLNGTYTRKLFNKPWISGASVIVGSTDFSSIDKVTGLITSMLIFQKNANTRYTLGIAAIADPSSQIPAFPIIAYWHRFKDPRWELDIVLPTSLKIRRSDVLGGWLSAGSEFNGFGYFLTDVPGTSKTYQNAYSELSFGLSYERIFAKSFMLSLQGGYKSTFQNRIMEVYERFGNAGIEIDMGAAPYIKAGIFFIIPNEKVINKTVDPSKQ